MPNFEDGFKLEEAGLESRIYLPVKTSLCIKYKTQVLLQHVV